VQRERGGLVRDVLTDHDLYEHVIFRCIVGSRAFGLDEPGSDLDRRGIYLPPAAMHWSLYGVPDQLECDATQECYWELQKFLTLALKANPNVLECLYSPLVEHATPLAERLIAMRDAFLSKLIYQTYNGYVLSQFKKLAARQDSDREIKWKHAMHLIRLLLAGITALREGTIPVAVGEHRERLLAIRRGQVAWEEIDAWRLELHRRFDEAAAASRLPDRPDYVRANSLLLEARREALPPPPRRRSSTSARAAPDWKAVHALSRNHRAWILRDARCACFCCRQTFCAVGDSQLV
jgi:predicted nucleotidyltransferase